VWTEPEVMEAQRRTLAVLTSGETYDPKFFTASEWKIVRLLADMIIPRDERSGSATDVGVPEFIDFMMIDKPDSQEKMRKGLQWFDAEMQRRYTTNFVDATEAERGFLLDELSWRRRAPESLKDGVDYFISFRNMVLTGFWTSKVGIDDLQYVGNTMVMRWEGCPPEALNKLGVSYNG
jgi:gluconate 2-dehydrogenase gamma chain